MQNPSILQDKCKFLYGLIPHQVSLNNQNDFGNYRFIKIYINPGNNYLHNLLRLRLKKMIFVPKKLINIVTG